MSGDWKASTFALSSREVAAALDVAEETVADLMLSGALGFWVPPCEDRRRSLPLSSARFDPADVAAYRETAPKPDVVAARAILENLRLYLAAHEVPTRSYELAFRADAPLEVKGRLYVRSRSLVAFARDRDAAPAAQLASRTEEILATTGAVRQRGFRAEDGVQRWAFWWRLPDAVWTGEELRLDEFLGPRGALAEDETTVAAPDGSGPVVDRVLPMDGPAWGDGK